MRNCSASNQALPLRAQLFKRGQLFAFKFVRGGEDDSRLENLHFVSLEIVFG